MRRLTTAAGIVAVAILTLTGCGNNDAPSDANESTSSPRPQPGEGINRDLPKFSSISIDRGVTVRVAIEAQVPQNVEVAQAVDETVTTKVKDGTLVVSRTSGSTEAGVIDVRVNCPKIQQLAVRGNAILNSAGKIDSYRVEASEGASIDNTGLRANDVTVEASESANVEIYAAKTAKGKASEGASVTVRGNPKTVTIKTNRGATVTSN